VGVFRDHGSIRRSESVGIAPGSAITQRYPRSVRRRAIALTIAVTAALGATGIFIALAQPTRTHSRHVTARSLFGVTELVAQVHPTRGTWLVVGGPSFKDWQRTSRGLKVGGAVDRNGKWRITELGNYPTSQDAADSCGATREKIVGPSGPVLVVQCWNGGSDGEHFVLVLGNAHRTPRVLMAVDCGQTGFTVHRGVLSVTSWELSGGGGVPSPANPRVMFHWDSGVGRLIPVGISGVGLPGFCINVTPNGLDTVICRPGHC